MFAGLGKEPSAKRRTPRRWLPHNLVFRSLDGRRDLALHHIKSALLDERVERGPTLRLHIRHSTASPDDVRTVLSPVFVRLSFQLRSSLGINTPESTFTTQLTRRRGYHISPSSFCTVDEAGCYKLLSQTLFWGSVKRGVTCSGIYSGVSKKLFSVCLTSPIPLSIISEKELLIRLAGKWLSVSLPLRKSSISKFLKSKKQPWRSSYRSKPFASPSLTLAPKTK